MLQEKGMVPYQGLPGGPVIKKRELVIHEGGWKGAWSGHLLSLYFLMNTVADAVHHNDRLPTSRIL